MVDAAAEDHGLVPAADDAGHGQQHHAERGDLDAAARAARGRAHYKVYKQDNETETNSHIRRLADEERIEEIAHMLSGATLTDAALNNAKALLGIA